MGSKQSGFAVQVLSTAFVVSLDLWVCEDIVQKLLHWYLGIEVDGWI